MTIRSKRTKQFLIDNNIDVERVYPNGRVMIGGKVWSFRKLQTLFSEQHPQEQFTIISTDDEVIIDGPPDGWNFDAEMIPLEPLNDVRDIYRSSETVEDNVEVVEEQPNKKRGRKPKGAEDV
jgi:hypothetical protein